MIQKHLYTDNTVITGNIVGREKEKEADINLLS